MLLLEAHGESLEALTCVAIQLKTSSPTWEAYWQAQRVEASTIAPVAHLIELDEWQAKAIK